MQSGGPRPWFSFAGLQFPVNDPSYPSATREYNDGLGRWLTPDPDNAGGDVGDSQSWDMYSYVGDNPTSRNDPSGESYYLAGAESCGVTVECDNQGLILDSKGNRVIITDEQVLSGAVGSTVGDNGVSTITTSQGTFQAQFFDNSPATYEVPGQPGSAIAAIGFNALFGLSNAANDFFAPIVGSRPSYMQDVPTGTGLAANTGSGAAFLATALIGPGGDANKIWHIFGKAAHNLGGLVQEFGSAAEAYKALVRATEEAVVTKGLSGKFTTTVQVGNHTVTVAGKVVNGVARIGTAYK